MDWFEKLMGFPEAGYEQTRQQLEVAGDRLRSTVNGKSYGVGLLELASLHELRERVAASPGLPGRLKVSIVRGDVRAMHCLPENASAVFQVASQFNLLEMTGPSVTPEHGVTGYQHDQTQGPACAMAAGAATIYRNYLASVDGRAGQTRDRQLDGLAELGAALGQELDTPIEALWSMQNGYAMCTGEGLQAIAQHLTSIDGNQLDELRGLLRLGIHSHVEVTDQPGPVPQYVSQVFCSALPVAYARSILSSLWAPFANLVLEAAYEATLWAAVLNAQRSGSNIVLLTKLGGGAFGNADDWIDRAMRRALALARDFDLDIRLVSYSEPSRALVNLAEEFA